MKHFKLLLPSLCLLMIFAAGCHKKNSHSQKTPKLTDSEIASIAVAANQIDVNHALIALKRSANPVVRKFALNMVTDHTSIIQQATALARKLGVKPKTNSVTKSLKSNAMKVTNMLKSKSDKAFNITYIDNEVAYHKAVIGDVQNLLIPQTKNKQLKNLLGKVVPVLKQHLQMAKNTQNEIGGKSRPASTSYY